MAYDPVIVTHPDDPACPGHDVNWLLGIASRGAGYCLCIHPFMTVIDWAGTSCGWCLQPVPLHATAPEMKQQRTGVVRAALGPGPGPCTYPEDISAATAPSKQG